MDVDAGPQLALGADCTAAADCASGRCEPTVFDQSTCVTPCTAQSDCGVGAPFFCAPGSDGGVCIPHSPAHCASCTTDSDCGHHGEICIQVPGDNAPACHVDCSLSSAACPADYACTTVDVAGTMRQLCTPIATSTCLDAVGGYCDRVTLPLPCTRTNTAGSCLGERDCMVGAKRFDKCNAMNPQCKANCSLQDPAGCALSFCSGATSTPSNCGVCGYVCPGYLQPNDNVTCNALQQCTFSCQGENYDSNALTSDGCEVIEAAPGNHTQPTAADAGSYHCFDSSTFSLNGQLPSDARVHESPAVLGFDSASGSAPDWYSMLAAGGFCTDDYVITLTVQGATSPACFKLTVITDQSTSSCSTDGSASCTLSAPGGAYTDGSLIALEVQRTCSTATTDAPSYTVTGHL
jgi:hypothetical protein